MSKFLHAVFIIVILGGLLFIPQPVAALHQPFTTGPGTVEVGQTVTFTMDAKPSDMANLSGPPGASIVVLEPGGIGVSSANCSTGVIGVLTCSLTWTASSNNSLNQLTGPYNFTVSFSYGYTAWVDPNNPNDPRTFWHTGGSTQQLTVVEPPPDLSPTISCPSSVQAEQVFNITTTVNNLTPNPAGSTITAFRGSWEAGGEGKLATGYPSTETWPRIISIPGDYTATVWANYCNPSVAVSCVPQINELNYGNNSQTCSFTVTPPPPSPPPPPSSNQPPSCSFSMSPSTNPLVGESRTFTSTSSDPDGSITSWVWSANGGSPTSGFASSFGPWSAATAATYTVFLTVTDNGGLSSSCSASVTVSSSPPPPPPTLTPPTIQSLNITQGPPGTSFSGTSRTSGRLSYQGGSNWLNAINIQVSAQEGSFKIKEFKTEFSGGFTLRYTRSSPTSTDWRAEVLEGGTWQNIPDTGRFIPTCTNPTALDTNCSLKFEPLGANDTSANWRVFFYPNFGDKPMNTGVTVTDFNNLSDTNPNCPSDGSACP